MVGWYRKFITNFAHTAKPLFNLLKDEHEMGYGMIIVSVHLPHYEML